MDDLTASRAEEPTGARAQSEPAILFVCTGNICRSPLAEAVCSARLARTNVTVASAALRPHHEGRGADPRAIAVGRMRGYALDAHRARTLIEADWWRYDRLMGMGAWHCDRLDEVRPPNAPARIESLTRYVSGDLTEIADPYHGSIADFERALDLIEVACDALSASLVASLPAALER